MFKKDLASSEDSPFRFLKQKQVKVSKKNVLTSSKISVKKLGKSLCRLDEIEPPDKESLNSGRPAGSMKALNILKFPTTRYNLGWRTPQLKRKAISQERLHERRRSSEWTKLRLTLEFIHKSREHINEELDEAENIRPYKSLTFLGQFYDINLDNPILDSSDDDEDFVGKNS